MSCVFIFRKTQKWNKLNTYEKMFKEQTHTHKYERHTHTHTGTHTQTHIHRYTYTDTQTQTHKHRHTYADTHTQTHIRRHTYTYTYTRCPWLTIDLWLLHFYDPSIIEHLCICLTLWFFQKTKQKKTNTKNAKTYCYFCKTIDLKNVWFTTKNNKAKQT